MEAIKALLKQVTSYWAGKDKRFKRNAIIIASSVLAAVIILAIILNHVPYATLYSGLNAEDSAAVMQALDEQKEPYRVRGDAILVPASEVDRLRMSLSTHVSAGFSLDILKQGQGLGTTESQMEDYRKRQLEHDISKAICTVEGVREARVFLTIPRESQYVLTTNNRVSTASLLLSLERGVELTPQQIRAIALFVQKAVPGLSLDNISIMDSTMQYLQIEEEPKEDPAEQTVDRYAMQSEVQAKLRRQVMALLVPVFGPGRVEAQVNVVLNFDDKTTDSKTFLPVVGDTKGIEVSAEKLREQVVNSREPGAEPGVDPNTGIDTYPAVASNEGTYEKIHEKVNYEVSSIYQHIVEAKGKIEKLSVAVVIDSTGMRADFTENVKNLVMNAVGASMENVSVQYMPMQGAQSFAEALEADKAKAGSLSPWLIAAVAGLVVLALALLSYLYVKSRRKAEEAAMQAAALAVQAEEEAAPVEEEEDEFPDISIVKDSSAKEQIGKLIELNPELVANLLRSWLADEQE